MTFGSNYSDEKPKPGMAAALATTGVNVKINTTDHNTYQQNFNTYIQQPDDVISWFAGYRMRAFASKGVVGDVSDVWAGITGMSEGFKSASSGLDGKQYFVPFYFYPWAVHYRKSLFEEKGYTSRSRGTSSRRCASRCRPTVSSRCPPPTTASGRRWACSTCSTCASTDTTSTSS